MSYCREEKMDNYRRGIINTKIKFEADKSSRTGENLSGYICFVLIYIKNGIYLTKAYIYCIVQ